jgi:hypothetical protein
MRFGRPCLGPARLRGGSSAWRAGSTGHQVPWAVAVMDLGEPPLDRHGLAVRLVVMSQQVSTLESACGAARTRSSGRRRVRVRRLRRWRRSDARPAGTAWRRRAGRRAGAGHRRVRAGPWRPDRARSRCRAAMRRLPGGRRPRREQVLGCVPARLRPAAGEGFLEECPGEMLCHDASVFMRPRLDSRRGDVHGRGMPSEDVLFSVGAVIQQWCWPQRGPGAETGAHGATGCWHGGCGLTLAVHHRSRGERAQ